MEFNDARAQSQQFDYMDNDASSQQPTLYPMHLEKERTSCSWTHFTSEEVCGSNECADLLHQLLQADPLHRLPMLSDLSMTGVGKLKNHSFFKRNFFSFYALDHGIFVPPHVPVIADPV